jgi:hydroxymethylglutaryl-CoA reductase (NADPH)
MYVHLSFVRSIVAHNSHGNGREGTVVVSTSRGCNATIAGGGAATVVTNDGMTLGLAIDFLSVAFAAAAKAWIDSVEGSAI